MLPDVKPSKPRGQSFGFGIGICNIDPGVGHCLKNFSLTSHYYFVDTVASLVVVQFRLNFCFQFHFSFAKKTKGLVFAHAFNSQIPPLYKCSTVVFLLPRIRRRIGDGKTLSPHCEQSVEQAADRAEAAAVDHYFSLPTEIFIVPVRLDTGKQTDDCFDLPVGDAMLLSLRTVAGVVCSAYEDMETEFDVSIKPNVHVSSDGACQWFPPGRFSLPCPIDISSFPFDDQTCSLTFQSWLYDGLKLNLTLAADKVETSVVNGEWDLLGESWIVV